MTIVYYHECKVAGLQHIAVTSKRYWDRAHCLDDGSGPDYRRINDALRAIGVDETCESYYGLAPGFTPDLPTVIAKMKELGFDLRTDAAFSAFLGRRH